MEKKENTKLDNVLQYYPFKGIRYYLSLLCLLAILISFLFFSNLANRDQEEYINPIILSSSTVVKVYLGYGFSSPGIYEFPSTFTYGDVISTQPNFYDPQIHKKIPLDRKLENGANISLIDEVVDTSYKLDSPNSHNGVFDINNTNLTELMQVPGIGPKTAQSILDYLENKRPLNQLDSLLEIKGIGDKTLQEIKKYYK